MDEEIKFLKENDTFILVKLPGNKNAVGEGGGTSTPRSQRKATNH